MKDLLAKVQSGADLTESEAEQAIADIMEGHTHPEEVEAFLLALRAKGEALSEVVGAARAMRRHALGLRVNGRVVIDTCGTGGDALKTANISTLAALVVAGAGVMVAKHGNRSITSSCGSADLLEALGVRVDLEPAAVERCIKEAGFGFLFAPRFHPAMKAVAPIRKKLGVPTIFNLLGPLTNPAGVKYQLVGVSDEAKMDLYAQALEALGVVHAMVVHGADGQDEISTTGATRVIELQAKNLETKATDYHLMPEPFGIQRATLKELQGGSPQENARIAEAVLSGEAGPIRDAVALNAAAALYVAGACVDLFGGLTLARESIDRGKARTVLQGLRELTKK